MDKRDANEKEIVRFFRQCGCVVIRQDRYAGFDLLVIDRDTCYVVEIKHTHELDNLTTNEKTLWELIGKMYHIVTSVEEAAKLIGR
jgi:Holliday junction resolvase